MTTKTTKICFICGKTTSARGLQGHISAAHLAKGINTAEKYEAAKALDKPSQRV